LEDILKKDKPKPTKPSWDDVPDEEEDEFMDFTIEGKNNKPKKSEGGGG